MLSDYGDFSNQVRVVNCAVRLFVVTRTITAPYDEDKDDDEDDNNDGEQRTRVKGMKLISLFHPPYVSSTTIGAV